MSEPNRGFSRRKRLVVWATLAVVVIGDRITKELARRLLEGAPPWRAVEVFPEHVFLHWTTNDAGFLGLLRALPAGTKAVFFIAATVGFVAWLGWLLYRAGPEHAHELAPISLLLAGFVGNGLDRVLHGAVIDFLVVQTEALSFGLNVADLAIFIGLLWVAAGRLRDLIRPADPRATA